MIWQWIALLAVLSDPVLVCCSNTSAFLTLPVTCPLLESPECGHENNQRFLEVWERRRKCWLCHDVSAELTELSGPLIRAMAKMDIGIMDDGGLQITEPWLQSCLPVFLLAMLASTRGARLQPWLLYRLALNALNLCNYDEELFFNYFGVSPTQLLYVFGLIGQPYDTTPQLDRIQEAERSGVSDEAESGVQGHKFWSAPLVVDVGMGMGADARYYLRQGFRVVGVEANPVALDAALADPGTASFLISGQLSVLNAAVSPPNETATHIMMWVIPQRPEQSKTLEWLAREGGEEVSVRTLKCADLLRVYGEVLYMKIDVEYNTVDCLASLANEAELRQAAKEAGAITVGHWSPPTYLSVEVEAVHLIENFVKHLNTLGYESYKVCRQFVYSPGPCESSYSAELLGCGSGPFGEAAVDYKTGTAWRNLEELQNDTEFLIEFQSGFDWFDLHVRQPLKMPA